MTAVEIEAAIPDLARQPFGRQEFSFAFLEAFGNKDTAIKRLRIANAAQGATHLLVRPREWFLVPLYVIDEAVQHIRDGTVAGMIYDPKSVRFLTMPSYSSKPSAGDLFDA